MIPSPWILLAVLLALGGAFVAGDLQGHKAEKLAWEAATAKIKAEAAGVLAQETAKVAAAETRAAEFANQLDVDHAKALADIDATRADFAGRLRIAASRACRSSAPAAEAAHPGGGAGTADRGDRGPGGVDLAAGERLRDYALALQAYAKTCHGWALSVGR